MSAVFSGYKKPRNRENIALTREEEAAKKRQGEATATGEMYTQL